MDDNITQALQQGGVIDITTTGRKSGAQHRIEIYFHHFDGEFFITGKPGFPRDWLANLKANPAFTVHLKRGLTADVAALATPIEDDAGREEVLFRILTESWGTAEDKARADLPTWVDSSPLISFEVV